MEKRNKKFSQLLSVRNLSKSFGLLSVIRDINFEIHPGEVVGLAGSTGSGKSVLVMLLAGLSAPDKGEITFKNKRLIWPFDAHKLGIGVIHQQPTLEENFDITSNIFLGNEIKKRKWMGFFSPLDREEMDRQASHLLEELGIEVSSLRQKVANLSGEQRQMIAIARIMTYDTSLLIVDINTLSLSYRYQQRLLDLIQQWRNKGIAVLFSSNDLDDLLCVIDRILILNQGKIVVDQRADEIDKEDIVKQLLGSSDQAITQYIEWDFDSYDHMLNHVEKLSYHRMLLEKELASEGTLNRQLTEQLVQQFQILDHTNQELREAQKRLLTEREHERKHLARELHDQIIQDLLGINYELEDFGLRKNLSPNLKKNLVDVRNVIRELVDNLRQICGDLRPPTIDSLGLRAALQSYTQDWSERTGIEIFFNLDEKIARLPEDIELSIFRIIQEGLNNIWKHAKASRVDIQIEQTSPRLLRINICDNGQGVDEDLDFSKLADEGHYGLLGISERVATFGGRMHIDQDLDQGFQLVIEITHPRMGE